MPEFIGCVELDLADLRPEVVGLQIGRLFGGGDGRGVRLP